MQYQVVVADPPWEYTNKRLNGTAARHYQEMPIAAIKDLPLRDVTGPESVLFLWATKPLLPEALGTMAAWGFNYRSFMVWFKCNQQSVGTPVEQARLAYGTGFWARASTELILIGAREKAKPPRSPDLDVISNRFQHSRKPRCLHSHIEGNYTGPYLELFATQERPGWTTIGRSLGSEVEDFFDVTKTG